MIGVMFVGSRFVQETPIDHMVRRWTQDRKSEVNMSVRESERVRVTANGVNISRTSITARRT